jgi:hypothetical protein
LNFVRVNILRYQIRVPSATPEGSLPTAQFRLLSEWIKKHHLTSDGTPEPAAPAVSKAPAVDPQLAELRKREAERANAERIFQQQERDKAAAYEYYLQQVQAGVLLDTEKNHNALIAYLNERKQFPTPATVQAAITALLPTLDKPEVLSIIPGTNERQLPIDASVSEMRRASKAQLQDLSKRRGEGQHSKNGWHGSNF